jgi:hypothetical protein
MKKRGPQLINLMKVPEYRKIALSKHNGKQVGKYEWRVGDNMIWHSRTGLIRMITDEEKANE